MYIAIIEVPSYLKHPARIALDTDDKENAVRLAREAVSDLLLLLDIETTTDSIIRLQRVEQSVQLVLPFSGEVS